MIYSRPWQLNTVGYKALLISGIFPSQEIFPSIRLLSVNEAINITRRINLDLRRRVIYFVSNIVNLFSANNISGSVPSILFVPYMALLGDIERLNSTFQISENKRFVYRVICGAELESGTRKAHRTRVLNSSMFVYLFGRLCAHHSIPPFYGIACPIHFIQFIFIN